MGFPPQILFKSGKNEDPLFQGLYKIWTGTHSHKNFKNNQMMAHSIPQTA